MPPKKQAKKKVATKKVTKKVTSKVTPHPNIKKISKSVVRETKRNTKNIKRSVTAIKNLASKLGKQSLKKKVSALQGKGSYTLRKLPIYKNQKTLVQFDHDIEANYAALNRLKRPGEFWGFTYFGNKSFQLYTSLDLAMSAMMKYKASENFGKDTGPHGRKLVDGIRLVTFKGSPRSYRKVKDAEIQAREDKKNAARIKEQNRRERQRKQVEKLQAEKRKQRNEIAKLKRQLKKSEAKNAKKKVTARKTSSKQSKVSKVANKKIVAAKTSTKRTATKKVTKVASKKPSNSKSKASKKGKR